jgi:peptidoglycan/xylan/chitin deacetylase (PgdA/CDA1 family)
MLMKLRQLGNRSLKSSAAPVLNGLLSGKRWLDGSKQSANQVMILGYHQVVTDIARTERDGVYSLAISAQTFRRQMEYVRRHYEVLTLDEAAAVLRGTAETQRPALVITFDDGYRNVYQNAFPVLREMGIPAIVFVNTGLIGTNQLLDHDLLYWYARRAKGLGLSLRVPLVKAGFNLRQVAETTAEVDPLNLGRRLIYQPLAARASVIQQLREFLGEPTPEQAADFSILNWKMVREMAAHGIEFGAHTENHPILTWETQEVMEREIVGSQRTLEAKLNKRVKHFAYPNGCANGMAKEILLRHGFETAVTTKRHLNQRGTDLLALGRTFLCEESTRGLKGQYSESIARLQMAV